MHCRKMWLAAGPLASFVLWSTTNAQLKCELTNEPSQVKLIYDDVAHFLRAMERFSDSEDRARILQQEYLDKASPGLKEYLREKDIKVGDFVKALRKRPAAYASLRELPKQLRSQEKKIREAFEGLKKLIPNTAFMPVYYLVGPRPGGSGEPSEYGLMIAISELDADIEKIHLLLVHETVHVQQALTIGMEEYQAIFGPKMSLLALAIREGAAEFLTSVAAGEHTQKEAHDYYLQNEQALWKRFSAEMNGRSPGDWMWKKPADPRQPAHLGYVVGARIVEAYYHNHEDKEKAVQDILAITDYQAFLEKSGYAGKAPHPD